MESVPVVAAPTNSSMRLPSSRGMSFPLRSSHVRPPPAARLRCPCPSGAPCRPAWSRRHHRQRRALRARLQRSGRVLRARVVDALERVQEGLRDQVQVLQRQIALVQLALGEDEVDHLLHLRLELRRGGLGHASAWRPPPRRRSSPAPPRGTGAWGPGSGRCSRRWAGASSLPSCSLTALWKK